MRLGMYIFGASNPETPRLVRKFTHCHIDGIVDDNPEWAGTIRLHEVPKGSLVLNAVCSTSRARKAVYHRIKKMGLEPASLMPPGLPYLNYYGESLYIQEGVMIQAECYIGDNVSIHMGTLVGHETHIGPHAFLAHGVNVCGRVTIREGAYIGAGATILPGITIGAWATVGAGSVVTRAVPDGATVKGVPAK